MVPRADCSFGDPQRGKQLVMLQFHIAGEKRKRKENYTAGTLPPLVLTSGLPHGLVSTMGKATLAFIFQFVLADREPDAECVSGQKLSTVPVRAGLFQERGRGKRVPLPRAAAALRPLPPACCGLRRNN